MEFTARQIADVLNGKVEGDPEVVVSRLAKIEEGLPGTMTFLANPLYTPHIYTTKASIIIVNEDFVPAQPIAGTLIRVENAYTSFAKLLEIFQNLQSGKKGISPHAFISKNANIGEDVYIGEFVSVGENAMIGNQVHLYPQTFIGDNVTIGDKTTIFAGVKIYHDCVVGSDCTLHAGIVIGADGFGFAPQADNQYKKVIQAGNVVIHDNVEIGANTTIDRATLGSTVIHRGVKIDNLVQLAHNVEIGENTVIAAQTGISGSTKIGKNCVIAGQVGIVGHLNIGDNVKIGAQSGIEHDIKDGDVFLGTPALEAGKTRRLYVYWRNFDQLAKKIYQLEKLLKKE
ncbi:MAG TPA: UDP-3-O-(3-hydroxymyristoyl)glucosamine N-acyltransferase [Bacteroidales bacterium]|nr:UDP-3-O-(3-hydroxymyristoyl)glucosamine N-acyltransferase [Bacteroidales bacterium]